MLEAPKIFISSTIYDFQDLRSSLKYFLQEIGFIVYMSEFNDFKKDVDINSYDTCLKTIPMCEYFILLIGARVGGFYNEKSGISITQMEYRTAYSLAMAGKIKIITLIRKDIWTIKEDRKALEQFLINAHITEREMDQKTISLISNHNSKFINDANFIFNFINEVSRVSEMKVAIKESKPFPVANWIHPFNSFADIVDSIKSTINIDHNINHRIIIENLKRELLNNLCFTTHKSKSRITPASMFSDSFRAKYQIADMKPIKAEGNHVLWLLFSGIIMGKASFGLKTSAIANAINSGIFYSYDSTCDTYSPGMTHEYLEILYDRMESFKGALKEAKMPFLLGKYIQQAKQSGSMTIETIDFLFLISAANACEDVFNLTKSIYSFIMGNPKAYEGLSLNSPSPLEGEDDQLANERATAAEIAAWING